MPKFGDRLRHLREEKGIKQTELAKMLNLSSSATISQYESNKRVPDAHILEHLAKILDCSIDYLLGITNIRNHKQVSGNNEIRFTYDTIYPDKDLAEFWTELINRDDLQTLVKQVKDLPPKSIHHLIKYIRIFEDEELYRK